MTSAEGGAPNGEFLLREYESLRQEQLQKIHEIDSSMRFALITTGAMWAWLLTHGDGSLPHRTAILWLPLIISLAFVAIFVALRGDISVIGKRIASLEEFFSIPRELAWESDVDDTFTRTRGVHYAVWGVLILTNLAGPMIFT